MKFFRKENRPVFAGIPGRATGTRQPLMLPSPVALPFADIEGEISAGVDKITPLQSIRRAGEKSPRPCLADLSITPHGFGQVARPVCALCRTWRTAHRSAAQAGPS